MTVEFRLLHEYLLRYCLRSHGSYLQGIVKEPPHTFKAAAGKLVFPQPVHGILNMLFIHIDVALCLTKSLGHKRSQPEQQKRKKNNEVATPSASPSPDYLLMILQLPSGELRVMRNSQGKVDG